MKRKDATFTFYDFYRDLNRAFRQVQAQKNFATQDEAMECAVNTPSSRFWVSEERLLEVIRKIESGKKDFCKSPLRKEMYEELYRRYLQCKNNPDNKHMTKPDMCCCVIYSVAPKFYITPHWALCKLYQGRRLLKNEK